MNELQDIVQKYGEDYRRNQRLPINQLKALSSIEACRTSLLGGHIDECEECGHVKISYTSCRNRHCPKYIGAQLGFMALLHTWGQNLMFHPHLHCIVPSGGLSLDGIRWINSRKNFFIPVKVLSAVFKGKFLSSLKSQYYNNKFRFVGEIAELANADLFNSLIEKLRQKDWIVYCKPPFESAAYVLQYLGRYTHRVAISNNRIEHIENGFVTFKWKDYKDKSKEKHMTVTAEEFIRRFLMHILPERFVKIRHFGFLGNRNKKTKLQKCKRLTGAKITDSLRSNKKLSVEEFLFKLTGVDIRICPCCKKGKMMRKSKLQPSICSPPKAI